MKRIGIIAFYDECGMADEYKLYLLSSLKSILSDMIIIISGVIREETLKKLYNFTNHIFTRPNTGYDGGAYKDVFTNKITCIKWELWDEIVLMNDTFYGPLYPWKELFLEMEEEKVDFWGLSRHGKGRLWDGTMASEHIQAYFIVVRKSMFHTLQWSKFWDDFQYPSSYLEAVKKFEIAFTEYFSKAGFRYLSWLDKNNGGVYIKGGLNPYMEFPYEIVRYCRFPVVKYRACSVIRHRAVKSILNYIENYTDYDKSLILRHIERMDREERLKPFGISKLEKFVASHQRIFIFGHGKYGQGLEAYFQEKGWAVSGFVVSVPNPRSDNEKALSDITLEKKDGLIIALANADGIRMTLTEKFEDEQLLYANS